MILNMTQIRPGWEIITEKSLTGEFSARIYINMKRVFNWIAYDKEELCAVAKVLDMACKDLARTHG